jgi:hypothetical protein
VYVLVLINPYLSTYFMKFNFTSLRSLAIALLVTASLVPAFAFAQQYAQNYNQGCNVSWQNWGSTNCTPGNLLVYVQVNNTNNNTVIRTASDFAVTVNAPTASPSSFPGSLSGTSVLVAGSYSVNVLQLQGYTASYSTGCTGTLANNVSGLCIVTESNTDGYNTYPNSYYPNQYYSTNPYGYNNSYVPTLTCSPSGQTVTIGQNVTFTAQGGQYSQFNWSNSNLPNNTGYNVGRSYTTTLLSPGTQTITVTNGQQNATCTVNVVGYPIQGYNYPGSTVTPINTYPVNGIYPVTVTPTYIPSLPNTGFAPIDETTLVIALAFIFAAALATYPYVRKALAITLR